MLPKCRAVADMKWTI